MKSILEVVRDLIKPYIDRNANNIAPVEVSPSENPYYVGDQLIFNGVLYDVILDINEADDLEVGVNISEASKLHSAIKSKLSLYSAGNSQWDTTPTVNSAKPVTSGGVKTEIDKKLPTYANDSTAWDTAPTASSTKPVTSGGVKTELDKKLPTYANGSGSWDTSPTASSTKPVTSGGVKTELDKKLPTYANGSGSWDTAPTNNSTKPVTSGGLYTTLKNEFAIVSGSQTQTMDLGAGIGVILTPPTGYTYYALRSFTSSNWTVPLSSISVASDGKVSVTGYKLISGSSSVTITASAIFKKSR